jgi:hypothetical protein
MRRWPSAPPLGHNGGQNLHPPRRRVPLVRISRVEEAPFAQRNAERGEVVAADAVGIMTRTD